MKLKKILCFVFALLICICAFPVIAFAEGLHNPMESTAVMDDLRAMHVDLSVYHKDPSAEFISVVRFTEYGYHAQKDFRYYGLFVYLYNPSGVPIDTNNVRLQMAYEPRGSATGVTVPFSKFNLEMVSVSSESGYENLFYKFKVSAGRVIAPNIREGNRSYHLSGIEFAHQGKNDLKDYLLKEKWTFTGYQLNFGRNKGDLPDHLCTQSSIEVIQTELHEATWKSNTSDLGDDYRYELSSVYFNIPDYFIERYGDLNAEASGLASVRGMYDKYCTNGLLVPDQTAYDSFDQIDTLRLSLMSGYSYGSVDNKPSFSQLSYRTVDPMTGYITEFYNLSFNKSTKDLYAYTMNSDHVLDVFYNIGISSTGILSSSETKTMLEKNWAKNRLLNSVDLFTDFKELGKDREYLIKVAGKSLNDQIKSFASSKQSNFLYRLFNKSLYVDEDGYAEIKPIVEIQKNALGFTDFDIYETIAKPGEENYLSEKYFVAVEYLDELSNFVRENKDKNHIYLMRFDVNPYYCPEVGLGYNHVGSDYWDSAKGFYFEKVIYENFDILEFSFKNEQGFTSTVPVNCTPIDVVGSIVPGNNQIEGNPNNPGEETDDRTPKADFFDLNTFMKIFAVILAVVALFVILRLLGLSFSVLFRGIGWVVSAPFKLIGKGVSFVDERIDRKIDRDSRREANARSLEDREYKREDQQFKREDQRMKSEAHDWKREDQETKRDDQRMKREAHDWKREDQETKRDDQRMKHDAHKWKREDQRIKRENQRMKSESHDWKHEEHDWKAEKHGWKREDRERKMRREK